MPKAANNNALWITYINITLYALCYQLQRPIEPFLVDALSKDGDDVALTYGKIQAFFSFIQTIGSPLVGILLDRVGIRKASAIVFSASALSYAILASATDLNLLFLSKVPTALQHAFLVAQATAATSTGNDSASRAAALGRMTTAYTIGATIGPALGGFLASNGNFYISAKYAVFGSLISVVLSLVYLPDGNAPQETSKPKEERKHDSFVEELKHTLAIASRSTLWPLLFVKVMGGVTASMHSTVLPMVLKQNLDFEPSDLGFLMSTSMFSVAAFGAFAMAPLTKLLGPRGMSLTGLTGRAMMGGCMALLVSAASAKTDYLVYNLVGVSVVHALLSHALATGLTTQTTGAVARDEQGSLLGLEHGLFSLARIGGAPMGTALLGQIGNLVLVESVCGIADLFLVVSLLASAAFVASPTKKMK